MSKQLSLDTAVIEVEKAKQRNCKHKFITVPAFDYENDEVYYFVVCQRCGLKTE